MSTNAPTTSSALEGVMNLDQWLVERDKVVGQVKRLVHLWFTNQLGSQRELAKHLQISPGTVSGHVKSLRLSGDLTDEQYAPVPARSNARIPCKLVENSTFTSTTTTVFTNDQQFVQRSNTEHLLVRDIPTVQSEMGSYNVGRTEAVEAVGTNHESSLDAERLYSRICRKLDEACADIYKLEAYAIDPSIWASVRGHIHACATVANCHRVSEDVLPLRNITND